MRAFCSIHDTTRRKGVESEIRTSAHTKIDGLTCIYALADLEKREFRATDHQLCVARTTFHGNKAARRQALRTAMRADCRASTEHAVADNQKVKGTFESNGPAQLFHHLGIRGVG